MIIDQSEIDALLEEAEGLVSEGQVQLAQAEKAVAVAPTPRPVRLPSDPHIARVLRVRVPVIVQLARRMMALEGVRDLSVGAIIEFEKSVEDSLDLMVNNRQIGSGQCVKVGENFGLRVTSIISKRKRLEAIAGA